MILCHQRLVRLICQGGQWRRLRRAHQLRKRSGDLRLGKAPKEHSWISGGTVRAEQSLVSSFFGNCKIIQALLDPYSDLGDDSWKPETIYLLMFFVPGFPRDTTRLKKYVTQCWFASATCCSSFGQTMSRCSRKRHPWAAGSQSQAMWPKDFSMDWLKEKP